MADIRKGTRLYLDRVIPDLEDEHEDDPYFDVIEFNPQFTGGKNAFAFNGSKYLKVGSQIQVEVLDVNRNPLYVEVGRSPSGIKYRDGVSTVLSIHVQSNVPVGVGDIYLLGTTTTGKSVMWHRKISIDSKLSNKSKIRFYKTPELIIEPVQSNLSIFGRIDDQELNMEVRGLAVQPTELYNYVKFDRLRSTPIYKLFHKSGDLFNSLVEGSTINLTDIVLESGSAPISGDFESEIVKVINNTEVLLRAPFTYPNSSAEQTVRNIYNASLQCSYTPLPDVSLATLEGSGSSGSSESGSELLYRSLARITVNNIRTFTGDIRRYKIYRKSFNDNSDISLISDGLLQPTELLVDDSTPDRQLENVGFFVDSARVADLSGSTETIAERYWYTSSADISLTQDSSNIIDGCMLSGSFNSGSYIIVKDDTNFPNNSSEYVDIDDNEILNRSGSSWDSNFVKLFGGVDYTLRCNLHNNRTTPTSSAKIEFYLTSSQFDYSTSTDFNEYGVLIGSYEYPIGTANTIVEYKNDFVVNSDSNGTLVIRPNAPGFTISNVSIQPKQEFSFSPDVFSFKVGFPLNVANEKFKIDAELFDIQNHPVPISLQTVSTFDPTGETLKLTTNSVPEDFITPLWTNIRGIPDVILDLGTNTPEFNTDVTFNSQSNFVSTTVFESSGEVEFNGVVDFVNASIQNLLIPGGDVIGSVSNADTASFCPDYVPYIGATSDVYLGDNDLYTSGSVGVGVDSSRTAIEIKNTSTLTADLPGGINSRNYGISIYSDETQQSSRPGIVQYSLRSDSADMAYDLQSAYVGTSEANVARAATFGVYANVSTGGSHTNRYVYLDARNTGDWNNATLKIDANNRVGIGIGGSVRPSATLDVAGDMLITDNIGINTTSPQAKLHIDGGTDASLSDSSGYLVIGDVNSFNVVMDNNELLARNNGATSDFHFNPDGGGITFGNNTNNCDITVNNGDFFLNNSNGRVGIGTLSPSTLLDVTGDITAMSVTASNDVSASGNIYADNFRRVGFAAQKSTSSVSGGSWSVISFVTEIEDTDTSFDLTTFTVPVGQGGMYSISGLFTFESVTDGNRYIVALEVNPSGTVAPDYLFGRGTAGATNLQGVGGNIKINLNAGDTIRMIVFCDNATQARTPETGYQTFSAYKVLGN